MNGKVEIITAPTEDDWRACLLLARATQGTKMPEKPPSSEWRKKILIAEHSPIRTLRWRILMTDIPYCNSVHFARHKMGVEHYVRSQRFNPNRGAGRQDAPVDHLMDINAAELIAMARKRLCCKADPVTRQIMRMICAAVIETAPEMKFVLMPECEYRGGRCPELKSCGKFSTIAEEVND